MLVYNQFMTKLVQELQQDKYKTMYQKQGINYLGLFGSEARGEARPDSDIDLLIDFNTSKTLFDLADVKIFFQELLHKKVDLVMRDSIKPLIKPYIEEDLITLYEQN